MDGNNHPLTPRATQILKDLVAFDSVSRNSNLPIIHHIKEMIEQCGGHVELDPSADGLKANLIARFGPKTDGGMVWSGHTDVVPVDGQPWNSDPFTLTEKAGILYGRGTADMKGFLACCLALAPQLKDLKAPVYFCFSYDEEVGCLGAPPLVRHLLKSGARPCVAIIGEPTMMQVVTAHKGVLSYETTVRGLEWHSSQPHLGVNAVHIACDLVAFLAGMAKELKEHGLRDERFEPPHTTVHVGTISGGTARNIIPLECKFHWEIRPLPNYDGDKLFERFQRKANELQTEMQLVSKDAGITTRPMSRMLGVTLPQHAEGECARLMHAAGTNQQHAVSFGTEAGVFNEGGIPAIICGPGDIRQAHKPNEFIAISQISECLHFLQKMIQ